MVWVMTIHAAVGPAEAPVVPVATCVVEIEGMPRPQLSHHSVRWAGQSRPARPRIQIELGEASSTVRLEGPRYAGELEVRAADCVPSSVLTLHATPLPALVQIFCPPQDTVMRCTGCEGAASERWYLPEQFPPIHMDAPARAITLQVKAVGYRPLYKEILIYPGRNVVRLDLEPLPAAARTSTAPSAPCLAQSVGP